MAQDRLKAATRRGMWILAACGGALGLAACGGSDPANDAVHRASLEINTLSLGGTNPMPDVDLRVAAYRQIVSDLQSATSAGTPATASAANMLVARAHAGLGAVEADALAEAELRAQAMLGSVRLQFDRYMTEHAQASSADGYDPAEDLADLDRQIKDKDAEIAAAWAEKSALDKVLAELEEKAAAESSLAAQERQLETGLRQRAINATAVEQADLIGRANEHKRAADARDKEASLLRAQATQRAPEGVTLQAEIDRLTDQRKLLDEAKAEIRAFAKATDDRAAAGRAEAMGAAERISGQAAELAKLRAEMPEIAERAIDAYDQAIRAAVAAGQAGGEARTNAVIAQAMNKHAKADLLAMRARGLRAYAELLGEMAQAQPPLPDSSAFATQAAAASTEAEKLAAEAKELLAEAQEEYSSAGGSGDAADRLQRLAASLGELTGVAMGEAEPEAQPEPEAAEVAADDGAADPEAEVRAMLAELSAAAAGGDLSKAFEFFDVSDPDMRAMLDATVELDAACREKFNKSLTELGAEMAAQMGAGGDAGMSMAGPAGMDFSQFTMTVNGPDSVTLVPPAGGEEITASAVKMDGRWQLRVEYPPQIAPLIKGMPEVYRTVAAEVRSGAIGTPEQLMPAMMQHMMPMIMQMQQQGGG